MSDEYLCSICNHRAGDHAVYNKCIVNGCNCRDDPYLEQFTILRKQLEIVVEALKSIDDGTYTQSKTIHNYKYFHDKFIKVAKQALAEINKIGGEK